MRGQGRQGRQGRQGGQGGTRGPHDRREWGLGSEGDKEAGEQVGRED
ncbi:MAG: hypothetical protein CLLPBCKN_002660 [Chroococcidiopsis cubana SAG 39.79]|nr:hypothetical protein [Chroococcidiopsis cubana]MDZ4873264.1 hypothetical protein [Chroococcidiopsis cubana SAG 39.79]